MQFIDHILILLIFVVHPIYSAIESRRYIDLVEAGQPAKQVRIYVETIIMQWSFLAVLSMAWWMLSRPTTDLGFRRLEGLELWGGTAVLVVMIGALIGSWLSVKRASEEDKKKHSDGFGQMVHFMPHTNRDLRYFICVSITAGIVEEIVYRGFVLWYLESFMPLWIAVVVSSIGFGLAHIYLGAAYAVRAGSVGLAFAIYYVLTGSIWLPILAHIALDVLQGPVLVEILRKSDDASAVPLESGS
jgi:hypothetical protein